MLWNKASVITTDSEELDISNIYKTKKNQQQKTNKTKKNHPNITTHIHVMVVKAGVGDTYSRILKTYPSYPWITENKWECALSLNLKNLFMSIHRQQRTNMQASPKWREIFYSVYGAADVKTNKSKALHMKMRGTCIFILSFSTILQFSFQCFLYQLHIIQFNQHVGILTCQIF